MENGKKSSGLALIPFLVFIVIYLGAGIILQSRGVEMAFYQFPAVVAMFFAILSYFVPAFEKLTLKGRWDWKENKVV